MRRIRSQSFRITAIAALVFGVSLVLALPAHALPICQDYQTHGDGTPCGTGQVCINDGSTVYGACVPFDIQSTGTTANANSVSTGVQSIALTAQTITVSSCLGSSTSCSNPTLRPAFWTGNGSGTTVAISASGLRPARFYTLSFYSQFEGTNAVQSTTAATWPAFPNPPVVSNIQPTQATVSWNTGFSGTTETYYGPLPPAWANETGSAITEVYGLSALGDGQAWAVSRNGKILKRQTNGSWGAQTNPDNGAHTLRDVDSFDDQRSWVVGDGGLILATTNGGSTWATQPPPAGFTDALLAVSAPLTNSVWAAGSSQKIISYNGATWSQKYSGTGGLQFSAIFSLDGKQIWAGGTNGVIARSSDAGATWTTVTVPSPADIYDVNTLDGQTIWAAGGSGRLWRSSNGGVNWSLIQTSATAAIEKIDLISPTEFWFTANTDTGHSTNAQAATPTITIDSELGGVQGGTSWPIAHINGGQLLAGGVSGVASYSLCNSVCSWKGGTAGTAHSITYQNVDGTGELLSGTQYYFDAVTASGSISYGAIGTFTTLSNDSTPPTISITNPNPSPKYTNVSPYSVQGVADDKDDNNAPGSLASVTLTNNGTPLATVTTNPVVPGAANTNWSSSVTLTAGMNTLVATAKDTSSNTKTASAQLFYDATAPNVTIAAPTNGSTVNTTTISANGTATDNDQIASVIYQLNNGPQQTLTTSPLGSSVTWNGAISGLTLGSNTLDVTATDRAGNTKKATVTFTYAAPTFTLDVAPNSQTKNAGDLISYTVTLTSANGFAAPVNLSATGLPSGSTASFSPQPANLPANGTVTSTLTFTTTTSALGTYTITVTGNGASVTASDTATLILNPAPDFTLSAVPVSQSIIGGDSTSYQIHASANSTFNGSIALTLSGQPSGVTGTFAPGSITLPPSTNQTSTLNISTLASATPGSHTLTVTGTSGSLTRTVTVILNISAPPDFTMAFLPASQTVTAGSNTGYNGTITAQNGFASQVNLTASVTPASTGIAITLTPNQLVPTSAGSAVAMNVTTTSAVTNGTYTITITGNAPSASPALTRTTTVTLVVNPDTTPPVISNIIATPNWDRVRIQWQTNEPADSQVVIYGDAAHNTLIGIVSDTALCTNTCHDLTYGTPVPPATTGTLSPNTTYYFEVTSRDADTSAPPPTPNSTTTSVQADGVTPLQFTTLDEPDTTPPDISVTQPAPGSTVVGTVTITGTATDNKNVVSVQIRVGTSFTTPPYILDRTLTCSGTTCPFSTSWNTTTATNGTYTMYVIAVDSAGNTSAVDSRQITLDNDNTAPRVLSGPTADVTVMGSAATCGGGPCYQAVIKWTTDDVSTSEIDYCAGPACSYNQHQQYDDTDPSNSSPIYTSHQLTLTNLDANQLYHYRITSCNVSGLCTH